MVVVGRGPWPVGVFALTRKIAWLTVRPLSLSASDFGRASCMHQPASWDWEDIECRSCNFHWPIHGPCLVPKKFYKIFQISRHIESLDACMYY